MYFVPIQKYTRRVHRTMYSHLARMRELWKASVPDTLVTYVYPTGEGDVSLLAGELCDTFVEAQALAIQKGANSVLNCSTGQFQPI